MIRDHFCKYLFDNYARYHETPQLMDYAFYPMKEMLIEILGVAEEKKDFKAAFIIVLCTQKISLQTSQDSESKHFFEFYYSQGVIRNRGFWSAALSTYRSVDLFD